MALWPTAWTWEAGSLDSQSTHETIGLGLIASQTGRIVMATLVSSKKGRMRQGLGAGAPEQALAKC